jgi:hypothetical protein
MVTEFRRVLFRSLAADLAAQALQMEVVREVDRTLGEIGQRIDRLLASRDEREAVLRELAGKPAEASAALERLGAAGPAGGWDALAGASGARPSDQAALQQALSAAGPQDAAGCGAPSGTWVMQGGTMVQLATPPAGACGAPLVVEDWMDELVRAGLEQGRAALATAQVALDGALIATSPVNLFRDYGPAVDAVLADLLPGVGTIEGTLLDDGIVRAIDERESTAMAVDTLRAAAKVASAALLGPAYIVAGLGVAAGDAVFAGTNRERVDAQRRLGVSDGRATAFESFGAAAAEGAVDAVISAATGAVTEAALEQAGKVGARFLSAVAGEEAAALAFPR